METEEVNGVKEGGAEESGKKDSISYPYKSFEFLVAFNQKIYDELGHGIYHTREQIAALHNLAPNSIKQILSTSQQFGLLEIKHGTGYKTTDLFASIILPGNDEEQKRSVIEALRKPQLYSDLISMYEKSGILPNNTGLSNTIQRNYKFQEDLAQRIARDFVGTLKLYGFLDDKNILRLNLRAQPSEVFKQNSAALSENPKPDNASGNNENQYQGFERITVPFGKAGAGRKAYVLIPQDYTDKDLKRIVKFLKALQEEDDEEAPEES